MKPEVHWARKALEGREELPGDLDEDTLASRSTLATVPRFEVIHGTWGMERGECGEQNVSREIEGSRLKILKPGLSI